MDVDAIGHVREPERQRAPERNDPKIRKNPRWLGRPLEIYVRRGETRD